MNKNRRNVGYAWVYVAAGVAILALFSIPFVTFMQHEGTAQRLEVMHFETMDELLAAKEALDQKITNDPVDNPERYFELLWEIRCLRDAAQTFGEKHHYDDPTNASVARQIAMNRLEADLQDRYTRKLSSQALAAVSKSYFEKHPEQDITSGSTPSIGLASVFGSAYLFSLPIMGLVFFIRLRQNGLSPLIELLQGWKPAAAIAAWPIAMWKYPNDDPAKQLANALRFATYVIVTMLSLGTGGMVKAGTSSKDGSSKKSKGQYAHIVDAPEQEVIPLIDPPKNPTDMIPVLDLSGTSIRTYGWVTGSWETGKDDFDLANLRVRHVISTDGPWSAYLEYELSSVGDSSANHLQSATATYTFDSGWDLTFGRLFLSDVYVMLPPHLQPFATYERAPFPFFADGVQVHGTFGNGWEVRADLTGKNGPYDLEGRFDRLESNWRLTRSVTDSLTVGSTGHLDEDAQHYSVDVSWTPNDDISINTALYQSNLDGRNRGLYASAVWQMTNGLELHGRLDAQERCGLTCERDLIAIGGLRARAPNDRLTFTLDYEHSFGNDAETDTGRLLARALVRF